MPNPRHLVFRTADGNFTAPLPTIVQPKNGTVYYPPQVAAAEPGPVQKSIPVSTPIATLAIMLALLALVFFVVWLVYKRRAARQAKAKAKKAEEERQKKAAKEQEQQCEANSEVEQLENSF